MKTVKGLWVLLLVVSVICIFVFRSEKQKLYDVVIKKGTPTDISVVLKEKIKTKDVILEVSENRFYIEIENTDSTMTILMNGDLTYTDITKSDLVGKDVGHISNSDFLSEQFSETQKEILREADEHIAEFAKNL